MLAPSTGYKLYGLEANGGSVTELLSFRTDAESLETASTKSGTVEYMDTTLERKYIDIIINTDEIYIFPLQHKIPQGSVQGMNVDYSGQRAGSNFLLSPDFSLHGTADRGFVYQMLLFADKDTFTETASRGMYVLLYTNPAKLSFADTGLPPYFGINYILPPTTEYIMLSHLMGYPDIDTSADSPAATAATTAENTITVTWSPVSYAGYALVNNEWTGEISGYKVYYSDSIITESTDLTVLTVQEAAASPAAINNLKPRYGVLFRSEYSE